jgi:putative nucleotidyltransferase with HDIG domain
MNKEKAIYLLKWAGEKNPGKWIKHCYNTARAAEVIAQNCGLDSNLVYIYGLLHDIGRYEGITYLRHIYSGYELMLEKGNKNIAKICLTHSFPFKDIEAYQGDIDCTIEEVKYLKEELNK